jgi:hypothetical protein
MPPGRVQPSRDPLVLCARGHAIIRRSMKNLLRTVSLVASFVVFAACSSTSAAPAPAGTASVCVMSGEALDANSPTADYHGAKVGFCCDKCQAKWNGLDDAGKKTAFDKMSAKK